MCGPPVQKGGNESGTERLAGMSVWSWVILGASAYLALSAFAAVGLSATFRRFGHDASDLLEQESRGAAAPLARKEIQEEQEALAEWTPLSERLGQRIRSFARRGAQLVEFGLRK